MTRLFTIFCMLLLTTIPAWALELSLEECLSLAVQNDRNLKAHQANEHARGEDVNIAVKSFFPTLKLTGEYTLLDRPNRLIIDANSFDTGMPGQDVHLFGDRRFKSASLLLEQPVFKGGKLVQNLNKSKSIEEQARLNTLRQQSLLKRDTGELFFRALNQQLQRETREKTLQAKKERLRILQELQAEGYIKTEDVLRQEAELSFAGAELYRFKSREKVTLNQLKNALYLDPTTDLTLKAPSSYQSLSPEAQNLKASVLSYRKDYLALQQQINAAQADVKASESRLYPQVSLYGEYTRQDENNLERDEVWAAGARLEWSIFEWGKNLAEIRRAKADKERLRYQQEAFAQSIKNETDDLWATIQEKEQVTAAWLSKTRASEMMMTRSVEEFAEGRRTLADLLEMEAEFFTNYNSYLTAINEQGIALLQLQAAVAAPLDGWLISKSFYQPDFNLPTSRLQLLLTPPVRTAAPFTTTAPATLPAEKEYSIQLGSFVNRENAEQLREHSTRVSGKPVIVVEIKGTFKVRVTGLKDFAEAKALLPRIQSELGLAGYIVRTEQ
ncbi:TolC family protein [Trichloromonas sp.]|uniref:TolC family protein n=1 Tax=Trichloromonas sp. TaxID=3069249 RepID=UPI003D81AB5F